MAPRKPKGDKPMERMLNMRVSNEFMEALEEAKWTLRKPMTDIIREAVTEYMERHLSKDAKEKVQKLLEKAPEEVTTKTPKKR